MRFDIEKELHLSLKLGLSKPKDSAFVRSHTAVASKARIVSMAKSRFVPPMYEECETL